MSEPRPSLIIEPGLAEASVRGRLAVQPWSDDDDEPSAGRMLGLSRTSTYAAIRSGQIPSVKVGNRILVPIAGLRRMLGEEV